MSNRVLLRSGCVLSMDRSVGNHLHADVLIEDGRISEVGENIRSRGAETIDATDTIVMPGFVDAHRHVVQSLFRNAGLEGARSIDWEKMSPDDVYAATLVGLLSSVEAGITSVVDWVGQDWEDDRIEASLQAHADSGARTVVAASTKTAGERPSLPARTRLARAGRDATDDIEDVLSDWAHGRTSGLAIHSHVADQPGAVAALGMRGALGSDLTLVHATRMSDPDLDAVASHDTHVVLCPASEMASGIGAPPVQKLMDRSVRPGLGIGNEMVAPGDLFAQMRATISVQHATVFDLKLAGKAGVPTLMSTRDIIRHATVDGARAAGLADTAGSLAPGRPADLILLRADRPNIAPVNDPIGAVVWGMDTSNVDWVFVAGKPLIRSGEHAVDVTEARALADAARDRVAAASGLLAPTGDGQ